MRDFFERIYEGMQEMSENYISRSVMVAILCCVAGFIFIIGMLLIFN